MCKPKGDGDSPHLRRQPTGLQTSWKSPPRLTTEEWMQKPSRLGLRHGTPLASRDVPGERGRLSSCIWNLRFFPNDARKNRPFVLTSFHPYLGFSPYFLTFLRSPVLKRKKCGHRQLWVYISTTLYPEGGKGSFAFFFLIWKMLGNARKGF